MYNIFQTHTGKIYVDTARRLEFLTVGDYGKENNIKADFLGYDREINGVRHRDVDLREKWVATISTQKGCPMSCQFCDVNKYGFYGNCSLDDLKYQIQTIIENEDVHETKRFNVHFARMGEPTFNPDVLHFTMMLSTMIRGFGLRADVVHPVVSTMLPRYNPGLLEFLQTWCEIKNRYLAGEAGLQFSINSTSDEQRKVQFDEKSLELQRISNLADMLPAPVGRKYTLNFAVTENTELDAAKLSDLFDKSKWVVKITPIHRSRSAVLNGYDIGDTYTDYNVYRKFEQPLMEAGWDVIVFVPSVEEDSDRITCGNALISQNNSLEEKK